MVEIVLDIGIRAAQATGMISGTSSVPAEEMDPPEVEAEAGATKPPRNLSLPLSHITTKPHGIADIFHLMMYLHLTLFATSLATFYLRDHVPRLGAILRGAT